MSWGLNIIVCVYLYVPDLMLRSCFILVGIPNWEIPILTEQDLSIESEHQSFSIYMIFLSIFSVRLWVTLDDCSAV